jgi:cytochrome c biogenesis factor
VIAETGHAALWLAAGLAALQLLLSIVALRTTTDSLRTLRAVAVVQGALTMVGFTCLFGAATLMRMRAELAEAKVEARMRRLGA